MNSLKENRLIKTFAELRESGRRTLLPFITAGFPDLQTTEAILHDFETRGVRVCELGIPFSDPIADGPVIQSSYSQALDAGVTSQKIFETVERYRQNGGKLALVAMVSYSIVFRHEPKRYLADARKSGFDAVLIPDLPLNEAAGIEALASACGLCNVMLVAPTTPGPRRLKIAEHSRGFIYYISVAGITGERKSLPDETVAAVAELKTHTDLPVCVGFGISNPTTVKTVCQSADGAIVGSALVHRIIDDIEKKLPREELVENLGKFVSELLEPLKQ